VSKKVQVPFQPPTANEVTEWSAASGCPIDGELFVSYWASVGWKRRGGAPVVDWKATARNAYLRGIDRKAPGRVEQTPEQAEAAMARVAEWDAFVAAGAAGNGAGDGHSV